jgi:acylphosphatase
MSTRATYTFRDNSGNSLDGGPIHVYKHHDGYPTGAAQWIEAALDHAWSLPRFEASDFAAAFVAANKPSPEQEALRLRQLAKEHREAGNRETADQLDMRATHYEPGGFINNSRGGGVRLIADGSEDGWKKFACDQEFHYEVQPSGRTLRIDAYATNLWDYPKAEDVEHLFSGTLEEFKAWALKDESAA